ncbi:MAG: hypothetical protein ACEPOZ_21335 [Marinifilaceae bacterium]
MKTLKSYLNNLLQQAHLLIGFYLENEALLSPGLVRIMDEAQLDLKDLIEIKSELNLKCGLIESIEIVVEHPRYFVMASPSGLIARHTADENHQYFSHRLKTFTSHANVLASEMHKANVELLENLPPLYREILYKSHKNRKEGFKDFLTKLVYQEPYPDTLAAEYQRIIQLISDQARSKSSLQLIQSTLTREIQLQFPLSENG